MKDLVDFKNAQITALQQEVAELREKNIQLGTWVFELCMDETPEQYKEVIKTEFNKYY
jgi:FtsZ-binding cell division protein ZapB